MNNIDYSEVKGLFSLYKERRSDLFTAVQKDFVEEMANKLNDLQQISNEITNLVSKLFSTQELLPDENDTINFMGVSIKLQRADPNIPIGLDNATKAYSRGEKPFSSKEVVYMENKLERESVEFYQIANRITHITERLPGLKSFKSKSVRIVRNRLIEHPEKITHDSFSYSKNEGPYIKGLRKNNQTQHMDKGFKKNSEEFISNLKKALVTKG